MAKGFSLEFLGKKITFYPLSLGQIQDLAEDLKTLSGADVADTSSALSPERMGSMIRIFTASARRGNPNITEEEVRDLVDMQDIKEATLAIMGASGLVGKADGDPDARPTMAQPTGA